jgi:fucose 4-O-acetylase-like acetyltransferase
MLEVADNYIAVKKPKLLHSATTKIDWVYHARGLAIILVVYRHIVIGMQRSGLPVPALMYNAQDVFLNFRMPAFFILSGVFIAHSLQRKPAGLIGREKVNTLLYPYLVWGIITISLQIFFAGFTNANRNWTHFRFLFMQPRALDHLWYLLALFNVSICYLLLRSFLKSRPVIHGAVAAGLHIASFYILQFSLFSDLFYFYGYFLAGTLLCQMFMDPGKRKLWLQRKYLLLLLPFFAAGQYYWYTNRADAGRLEFLFVPIIFIGCYVLFLVAFILGRYAAFKWLAVLGKYSLYIYLLHVQVGAIIRKVVVTAVPYIDMWVLLLLCVTGGILMPIVLVKNLRPFGIERLFTLSKSKSYVVSGKV